MTTLLIHLKLPTNHNNQSVVLYNWSVVLFSVNRRIGRKSCQLLIVLQITIFHLKKTKKKKRIRTPPNPARGPAVISQMQAGKTQSPKCICSAFVCISRDHLHDPIHCEKDVLFCMMPGRLPRHLYPAPGASGGLPPGVIPTWHLWQIANYDNSFQQPLITRLYINIALLPGYFLRDHPWDGPFCLLGRFFLCFTFFHNTWSHDEWGEASLAALSFGWVVRRMQTFILSSILPFSNW